MIIEELGPTFIKLAQALSNRADLLPEALIDEFEKLQSNVPPFPVAPRPVPSWRPSWAARWPRYFEEFEDAPIGSASIGQVHRARLHGGEEVVVKVQRPGVREKVAGDLRLLHELVRLTAGFFARPGPHQPPGRGGHLRAQHDQGAGLHLRSPRDGLSCASFTKTTPASIFRSPTAS